MHQIFHIIKKDTHIIFNEIISTDIEKWTYNELDDLIYGFIKTANYLMGSDYVSGYIELINEKIFLDNYLENDIE